MEHWKPRGCPISPAQSFGYRHVCPEHPAPEPWRRRVAYRWHWLLQQPRHQWELRRLLAAQRRREDGDR